MHYIRSAVGHTKGKRSVPPQGSICARITFSWAYKLSDIFARNHEEREEPWVQELISEV